MGKPPKKTPVKSEAWAEIWT